MHTIQYESKGQVMFVNATGRPQVVLSLWLCAAHIWRSGVAATGWTLHLYSWFNICTFYRNLLPSIVQTW